MNRIISLLTILMVVSLGGCTLLDPGPPMTQVILPVRVMPAKEANRMPVQLLVGHPVTGSAGGTDRILALMNGYEVRALDSAKWASTTPWMVQRLLIDSLEASRRFEAVGWEESSMDATVRLSTDIRRFHLRYDGDQTAPYADVMLILTLTDLKTNKVFGRNIITAEERCTGNSLREFVAAFSIAMTKVLDRSNEWVVSKVEDQLLANGTTP